MGSILEKGEQNDQRHSSGNVFLFLGGQSADSGRVYLIKCRMEGSKEVS